MDKYRIYFRCIRKPEDFSELTGYDLQKVYVGRTFNGLYEVAPQWGTCMQTKVIEKGVFKQYFEIVNHQKNK